MARKRRRRRSYGSYVSIPSLGKLDVKKLNPLGKTVNTTDLFLGAIIGLAGGSLVKMGVSKIDVMTDGKVPAIVKTYVGPISTFVAGVLAAMFMAKGKPAKANAFLAGAALTAATPIVWEQMKRIAPAYFNDYVSVSPFGVLTQDAGGFGVLTQDSGALNGFGEDGSEFYEPGI